MLNLRDVLIDGDLLKLRIYQARPRKFEVHLFYLSSGLQWKQFREIFRLEIVHGIWSGLELVRWRLWSEFLREVGVCGQDDDDARRALAKSIANGVCL